MKEKDPTREMAKESNETNARNSDMFLKIERTKRKIFVPTGQRRPIYVSPREKRDGEEQGEEMESQSSMRDR